MLRYLAVGVHFLEDTRLSAVSVCAARLCGGVKGASSFRLMSIPAISYNTVSCTAGVSCSATATAGVVISISGKKRLNCDSLGVSSSWLSYSHRWKSSRSKLISEFLFVEQVIMSLQFLQTDLPEVNLISTDLPWTEITWPKARVKELIFL